MHTEYVSEMGLTHPALLALKTSHSETERVSLISWLTYSEFSLNLLSETSLWRFILQIVSLAEQK